MPKLLIATPAFGDMYYTPYVLGIFRLQRWLGRNNWSSSFASISYADIVEARNFLLTHWYDKTDASHVLFIDADMGFEPELIASMLALDQPLVGVIYPKRQVDVQRVAALAAKGETAERAVARAHEFIVRPVRGRLPRRRKGFIEVAACGAGILLVRRDCIKTMLAKLPELSDAGAKKNSPLAKNLDRLIRAFEPLMVDGARLSEDFAFCHRWRELCRGEIWASVDQAVTHVGLQRFASRYVDAAGGPRIVAGGKAVRAPAPGQKARAVRLPPAAVKERGKGPRVITGKLALPKKRDKGKPVKH